MAVERKFIEDSILRFKITKFMKNQLSRAGFSKLNIQRTPLITLITAEVTNPGRVIGRKGRTINRITDQLRKEFNLENPKINIASTPVPDLEPLVVARRLARLIEMGKNPRRMMHFMVKSIMKAGATGCEVVISGKLGAKGGRARTFRSMAGYLPKAGEPARWVKQAHVTAYPKAGAIGVTVKIAPPDVEFPDKKKEEPVAPPVEKTSEPKAEEKPKESKKEASDKKESEKKVPAKKKARKRVTRKKTGDKKASEKKADKKEEPKESKKEE